MPNSIKSHEVIRLIELLSRQTGESLDYSGFGMMSLKLEKAGFIGIAQRYLYTNAWKNTLERIDMGEEQLGLRLNKLDQIAKFLGYDNFQSFQTDSQIELNEYERALLGNWESYSRNNSGKKQILVSSVSIFEQNKELWMELFGPIRTFKGKIEMNAGCITSILRAKDKVLFLTFSIGKSQNPKVLQGVFSGISTAGEPIAGREVLIRLEEEVPKQSQNRIIYLEDEENCASEYPEIISYFSSFSKNYVKIKRPSSFTLEDLVV